jgi:subtilisin family serine protease
MPVAGQMKGDSVRLRLGTAIAVMLVLGATFVGSSAGARPTSAAGPVVHARTDGVRVSKLPTASAGRVVPRRLVVVWRAGVASAAERSLTARVGIARLAPTPGLGVDVVHVPRGRSVDAAIGALRRSPLVRSVEPDRIATIATTDPRFVEQWSLNNPPSEHEMSQYQGLFGSTSTGKEDADVDAPEAWAQLPLDPDPVVVAVLDTGVDLTHPDLADALWTNSGEDPLPDGEDDDLNGFIDDIHGYDFKGDDGDPTPSNGIDNSHGTHVSGIVAATPNNAKGIAGVCPDCQIMALRLGTATSLTLGNELKAINYAIANGADVINMSFGSAVWSGQERSAIGKAGRHGILVVIAAGNASSDNDIELYAEDNQHVTVAEAPAYPASYTLSNILSVAATNDRDQYAYISQCRTSGIPLWNCGFTSWGHDSVDVAAPGVDILSTVKQGQGPGSSDYAYFDGTSMATPLVAGIAGLVLSENTGWTPVQVKNAIMHSVDHPSNFFLYDSWADLVGVGKKITGKFTRTHGRVNAVAALTGSTTNATPKTDGNIDGARAIRGKRTGTVSWPADANDVFHKRLTKGATYRVVLNGPKGKDFDLWVWRPGTKEIFQFTSKCFATNLQTCPSLQAFSAGRTADEAVTFKAPKTGVFYLQVNGWYSGGSYVLTIKKV